MKVVDSMTPSPVHVTPNDTLTTARSPWTLRTSAVYQWSRVANWSE
jgi:hypothetical protein